MGKGERERERLREERIAAEQGAEKSDRNRMVVGYAVVSTVVLVVAVIVFVLVSGGGDSSSASGDAHINGNQEVGNTNGVQPDDRAGIVPARTKVFDLDEAAKQAGCDVELKLEDEGKEHLPPDSPEPNYKTNPPTSGNHVEPPYQQADGAYSEEPKPLDVVHSLEHGRMAIQYSPDLPEKAQLELKGLYDTMYGATLLFPNDGCPTRWRRRPGPTCSAATPTRARSRSTRSAPSAGKPGANTVASRRKPSPSPGRRPRSQTNRAAKA